MLLILSLFVVASNLILGVLTYLRNRKSATNILFASLTIVLSLWTITNYLSVQESTLSATFFWLKLVMAFSGLMFPVLYLLVKTFPRARIGVSKLWLLLILLFAAIVVVISLASMVFSGVTVENDVVTPISGPALPIFAVNVFLFLILTIITLYRKYRIFKGVEKIQLKYLIYGITLTFVLSTFTNFVLVNLLGITSLVAAGPLFTVIMTGFISYGIVKHDLFNIKVIAAQVLTTVIWIILFSKLFVSQTTNDFVVDLIVFVIVFVFGILLLRSVSKEVEQREKLEELTKKLKAIDKQKDEFINMAAHELRAPMTAIKGYVSMIMDGDAGEIPEKALEYLADTMSVTDRLVRLVNNMLNVGRIEEGRMVYRTGVVSLKEVAKQVEVSFRFEAQRKGLDLHIEAEPSVKDNVEVDPDRIHEVVGNFVSNAVKYTDKGSVVMRITQPKSKLVRLEVVDTGPGISVKEQDKLFQKFFRVESTAGKTIGTGLGLYISKLLIEKFGGTIGLKSGIDKGSNFWFELPVTNKNIGEEVELKRSKKPDAKAESK